MGNGWDRYGSRGFWTRRRKTATSLFTVFAVLGGLAVAFKLFDQTVANNVVRDAATFSFEIWKRDSGNGDPDYINTATGRAIFEAGTPMFPGDTRTVGVKIRNTNVPARDATFQLYIDEETIRVSRCSDVGNDGDVENDFTPGGECAGSRIPVDRNADALRWSRFVGFWSLHIEKQAILQPVPDDVEVNESGHTEDNILSPGNDGEPDDPDDTQRFRYLTACETGLRQVPRNQPCGLGNVKGLGSDDTLGEATDVRYYRFNLTEQDLGELDQTEFRGWELVFDMVFQAQVPARPEDFIER